MIYVVIDVTTGNAFGPFASRDQAAKYRDEYETAFVRNAYVTRVKIPPEVT